MLIILHGKDTFRSRQKLRELEGAYKEKHKSGFSFEKLDAQETDFKQIKNSLQSVSLFDSFKLVVLEGLAGNKTLKSDVVQWQALKNISEDKNTIFILYETSSVASDKEYKKIISLANKKQEFKEPSQAEMIKWLGSYFEKIPAEIIKEVVSLSGSDMWRAYNELSKLRTYSADKKVTKDMLKVLSVGNSEAQIFPTIDAIFRGDTDKAFHDLLLHWRAGEAPEYVFYMLERQIRILAQIKEERDAKTPLDSIAKKTGQHPYVVKKTVPIADRFSWPKIKNLYSRVESLDAKAKTGQLNSYLSCEMLSAAIVS